MRMAYSYRRFPYGHVAHQAAGVIIRAWRAHHRMKNAAAVRAQSAMRRWHTRRDFMDMRTTLLAAMTIIQSHARVKLARLRVHRIRAQRAHRMAQRLQSRWRGGIGRKEAAWWRQERRRLSATNIQRRWRGVHGRRRFSRKLEKRRRRWRATGDIQRVFRGYLHGRRRRARRIFWALCTLQRICRGFCGRLRALEKLRFRAAAHVQKLVRGHRGRKYARQKRADMIEAERKRRSGEQEMERIAEMDARMKLKTLLKSKSGKKELRAVMTKLREEHRRRKKEYALMTPMQRERRDVENIFRKYDADRSGSIDKAEFAILLRDLCIPLRPAELERTMLLVDTDGSGTIEFDEFFFWYTTEASGTYSLVSTSQGAASARELQFAKARLRARKVARDIIGYSLKAEAVRYLEAEKMKHAKRRAARAYRLRPGRRPNFACRKCLEPFVFSFDLEKHPKNCLEIDVYHDMQERAEAEHAAQEKEKELQRKGAAAEENDRRAARQRAYG